jgi:hypothetical protein
VRGIPSPFIKIYERGRDTPHPSLCALLPSKEFFDGILVELELDGVPAGGFLVAGLAAQRVDQTAFIPWTHLVG